MLSPLLGIKTHFWEVGFRDAGPTHFSHLWPFFSRHSCAPSTLGRDLSVWQHGSLFPQSVSGRSSSSWRGTSQVTYVTLVPRGNETLRLGPYFGIPASGLLHSWSWRRFHRTCFLCFLADYVTRPWCLAHPLDRLHMCSERGHAGAFPKASSGRRRLVPSRTRVTYVTWEGLLTDEIYGYLHSIFPSSIKRIWLKAKNYINEKIGQRDDTQIGYLNWNWKLRLSE